MGVIQEAMVRGGCVCLQITLRQGAGGRCACRSPCGRGQAAGGGRLCSDSRSCLLVHQRLLGRTTHPPEALVARWPCMSSGASQRCACEGRGWLLGVQANEHAWQEGRGRPISEQTQAARWQHMPGEPPAIPRLTGFIAAMELEWVVSSRILDRLKSWLRGAHRGSVRGGKWV